jgi:hypothetical protein
VIIFEGGMLSGVSSLEDTFFIVTAFRRKTVAFSRGFPYAVR